MKCPKDPGRGDNPRTGATAEPPDPGEGWKQVETQQQPKDNKQNEDLSSDDWMVPETPPSQEENTTRKEPTDPQLDGDLAGEEGKRQREKDENKRSTAKDEQDMGEPQQQTKTTEQEVLPSEMFEAVIREMRGAADEPPREEWKATVAALFKHVHASVNIKEELVPRIKQRYPKPKSDEVDTLYKFFEEVSIASNGTYDDWSNYARTLIQDLYNTNWSLKNIMESMMSKMKWARILPHNQWTAKTRSSLESGEGTRRALETTQPYEEFMFNPRVFSRQDTSRLRTGALAGNRLREGTKDEWKIISGLAEGSIVCRHLPAFIKSVLAPKEQLRLYTTIQRQVEGELVIQLRNGTGVASTRQQTRELKEDIMMAAERFKVNTTMLYQMLNMTKTISYNSVRRSIHFFFFDRQTALKFQLAVVPYKGTVYRVVNVHREDTGSVWDRQLDGGGVRMAVQTEYEVTLYHISRFMDIGRFTAYLQERIAADFELEDTDTCLPNSSTSTTWKLTDNDYSVFTVEILVMSWHDANTRRNY
ncbi:Hypothetical protein PHPALM_440 [Phytophthora palmivora]|uniref:Uncharacterized protein n=1 Tax=Phytophthora palmivora TaxID=4796 RepID=A0A2P4YUU5_9STRA|nr:Hypothetical protein PHPALM_440 [Phytophthora palmivora]